LNTLKKIIGNLAFQVLVAILLGAAVGHFYPVTGVKMEIIGKSFVDIIKLFIGPIIFLTITLGIGGIGDLKKVGRVGLKALIYFEVVTTFALTIGINLLSSPATSIVKVWLFKMHRSTPSRQSMLSIGLNFS
jgi:aerobic C4-dicarboxylate transport protein